MSNDSITITLTRTEVAYLHRQVAFEALAVLGLAARGALKSDETARKDWLVALSDRLAVAQGLHR